MARYLACFIGWMLACLSCQQNEKEKHALQFNPEPAVIYQVHVSHKTEQRWTYQGKPWQVSDSFHMNYAVQLLQKNDSLQLLQLRFIDFFERTNSFTVNTVAENLPANKIPLNPLLLYDYLLHFVKGKAITVWMDQEAGLSKYTERKPSWTV